MSLEQILKDRSSNACELCKSDDNLSIYSVEPSDGSENQSIYICAKCKSELENPTALDENHWQCLNDSMWSEVGAVQVVAYRLLTALGNQDALDMLYLEDDVKTWADANPLVAANSGVVHRDSNGTILNEGDTVTLIKDLDVKGGGFTAKRGTVVKNIRLTDDPKFIEGKINGTTIVLVADYMKKA